MKALLKQVVTKLNIHVHHNINSSKKKCSASICNLRAVHQMEMSVTSRNLDIRRPRCIPFKIEVPSTDEEQRTRSGCDLNVFQHPEA